MNTTSKMRTLLHKYLADTITPGELGSLRKEIEKLSDSDIEREMYSDWVGSGLNIKTVSVRPSIWIRALRWVAAVLLPLFAMLTVYLYNDNRHLAAQDVVVATLGGERASVQLPDGSTVTLNSNSRLTYSPAGFASSKREVHFEGEGFFNIKKDVGHPFSVNASQLMVNVMGTAFNLLARDDMDEASLYLEEGAVEMMSIKTGGRVGIEPGQLAVLNYSTGRITVTAEPQPDIRMAWRTGDLVYINEPLDKVLQSLGRNYNYKITLDSDEAVGSVPFTGTLSSTNIYDAVHILELTFDLSCSGADSILVLSKGS